MLDEKVPDDVAPADRQTCQSRMAQAGPWQRGENLDWWRHEPNGDRTCSFCGSLHPADWLALLKKMPELEGAYVHWSDKNYKLYIHRPEIRNASEGGIKFYTWHIPDAAARDAMQAAHDAIRALCSERINATVSVILAQPAP